MATTETATVSADRGTRADSDGYTQLAWGGDVDGDDAGSVRGGGVSAARSGR